MISDPCFMIMVFLNLKKVNYGKNIAEILPIICILSVLENILCDTIKEAIRVNTTAAEEEGTSIGGQLSRPPLC